MTGREDTSANGNIAITVKVLGFHSSAYEEWRLLRYYAVWLL
jgi:hypothetical protein